MILGKKAMPITQVFVYLLSTILVVFAGFLVIKFVFTFNDDVEQQTNKAFFDNLEIDYQKVFSNYGSEITSKYKVSAAVELVCFVDSRSCIDSLPITLKDDAKLIYDAGDNVYLYSGDEVLKTTSIGEFNLCECKKPKVGLVKLFYENRRNDVFIEFVD